MQTKAVIRTSLQDEEEEEDSTGKEDSLQMQDLQAVTQPVAQPVSQPGCGS
jgi:hypothetical protein